MSIRDKIEEKKGVIAAVALVVVVLAIWQIISQLSSGTAAVPSEGYYTIDDGQNWFKDDVLLYPPFEKDGKTAVRAHMYECGGKLHIGYLSRYLPEAKAILEKHRDEVRQNPEVRSSVADRVVGAERAREYKKPGESEWTRKEPSLFYKCPDGTMVEQVLP